MQLSSTTFGHFELYTIETGRFKLDGGAMFGVVPKTLWSRTIKPDEKNRIPMAMRCLLIKSDITGKLYLIDTGIGTKFNEKMTKIYGVNHEHSSLLNSLAYHNFTPDDVTDIIFSHLHFDHCGGTTYYDNGEIKHRFPNAIYHVLQKHWETATQPNAREKASFLEPNINPIGDSNRLNLIDEGHDFEEGLTHYIVNGHTLGQQLPIIRSKDETLVFVADLIPTTSHISIPWVMAYDMYPAETLKEKRDFLELACKNNWYLYLEHDAVNEVVQVERDEGRYKPSQFSTLNDLTTNHN